MNNYIDLHSHILDSVDDGSNSLDESVEIVRKLKEYGFNTIVATPHYIEGSSYDKNNEEKKKRLAALKRRLKKENIDIKISLGNEIFICQGIDEYIRKKEISPIGRSKYLLIELPFNNQIELLEEHLFRLRAKGWKIIIAHPERYAYFQRHPIMLEIYVEQGILFQSNYGSLVGNYGRKAQKTLKYFLKHDYIAVLSSDVHKQNDRFFKNFPRAVKKLRRMVGQSKMEDLTYNNAEKIINNKSIYW